MKPAVANVAEIHNVIQDLSEIEDSLGESRIKEVYMCPPELLHKKFVKPKISNELVDLNENTTFNLVETQAMELEVEGKSFIIKSFIEPGNHIDETEENCSDCDETYHTPMFYYRHLKYNHEKIEHDFLSKKAHRG